MELVQLVRADRAEQVHVQDVDLRRPFGAVRRRRRRSRRRTSGCRSSSSRSCTTPTGCCGASRFQSSLVSSALLLIVCDRPAALRPGRARPEEAEQREPLAVGAAVDQRFVGAERRALTGHGVPIGSDRFGRSRFSRTPSSARKVERLVLHERSADRAAELLAVEIGERLAVRGVRGQPLEALVVEQAALDLVGARLGDHVDDAAGGAAELGARRRSRRPGTP